MRSYTICASSRRWHSSQTTSRIRGNKIGFYYLLSVRSFHLDATHTHTHIPVIITSTIEWNEWRRSIEPNTHRTHTSSRRRANYKNKNQTDKAPLIEIKYFSFPIASNSCLFARIFYDDWADEKTIGNTRNTRSGGDGGGGRINNTNPLKSYHNSS